MLCVLPGRKIRTQYTLFSKPWHSGTLQNDLHAVWALKKKKVWKTAWDFNLKIIFLNWQNEVDSFPITTQLIKRKPTVNFTVERGLLCFKPSLTSAFIKLPYSLMFSSWYYFSIGVEVVAKAYIRVPVLFCSWQPFLNFENLNPTSHLKLKTEFWRAIWFS